MSIVPNFQYLLVLPNGNVKGFNDLEPAKGYINIYYDIKVKDVETFKELNDFTDSSEQLINSVCQNLGVEEGECKVYNTLDVIESVQNNLVFDDEKEEIISKLLSPEIHLNIYNYSIDNIFDDVEPINMIETYGQITI